MSSNGSDGDAGSACDLPSPKRRKVSDGPADDGPAADGSVDTFFRYMDTLGGGQPDAMEENGSHGFQDLGYRQLFAEAQKPRENHETEETPIIKKEPGVEDELNMSRKIQEHDGRQDSTDDEMCTDSQASTDTQAPLNGQGSDEGPNSDDSQDSDDSEQSGDSESDGSEDSDDGQETNQERGTPHQLRVQSAVHNPRFREALGNLTKCLCEIGAMMSRQDLTKDPKSHLSTLYQETRVQSLFRVPETRTLGFIGESGAGKSSVINSLLGQKVARSSRSGSACTCVVTEFRNADFTSAPPYTIEVLFMMEDEIHELLEELLRDFRQYNHQGQSSATLDSTQEQSEFKNRANRAWETLQTMFKHQRKFSKRFLKSDVDELEILDELKKLARSEMTRLPGLDGLHHTMTAHDLDQCRSQLEELTSSCSSSNGFVLWPFIKLIKVYLHSPILQKGLVLVDMPGLRDLNFARVRATETYLLRNCDEVFIVSEMSRCSSNVSIMDIKRNFSSKEQQGIIITRAEDVNHEESVTDDNISQNKRQILRGMKTKIENIESQIQNINASMQTANREELTELVCRRVQLEEKLERNNFQRAEFLINERNKRNTRALLKKHSGMRVFCVSNELFSVHHNGQTPQAEAWTSLSGIPSLRDYCETVPADAQTRITNKFVEHGVQSLITSIRQWCLTGLEPVTAEKGITIRKVLSNALASFLQNFQSQEALVIPLQRDLDRAFNNSILQTIQRRKRDWSQDLIKLHDKWKKKWHHSTYAACCRHNGAWGNNSWNDKISAIPHEDLKPAWKKLFDWLDSQTNEFSAKITASFAEMQGEIKSIESCAPRVLENLLVGLELRQEKVIFSARDMIENLKHDLKIEQRDMLGDHDSSWLAGLMRPAYLACNRFVGPGSHKLRLEHMDNFVATQSPFTQYYERSQAFYGNVVRSAFSSFQVAVLQETGGLEQDTNSVISAKGKIPETEIASDLVDELISKLPALEEALQATQAVLKELQS